MVNAGTAGSRGKRRFSRTNEGEKGPVSSMNFRPLILACIGTALLAGSLGGGAFAAQVAAAGAGPNACTLVTQAEVAKAFGVPIDPPQNQPSPTNPACQFGSHFTSKVSVVLRVIEGGPCSKGPADWTPKAPYATAVPGVGTAAYYAHDAGYPYINVQVGSQCTMVWGGVMGGTPPPTVDPRLVAVAKIVASRMSPTQLV
jgi:hypothetical protein